MGATLYTIGHGRRNSEDFLALLKKYDIEYLIDVRSLPFSRFNPQYNQKALKNSLHENGIHYVFMGDTLGGRPKDPSCYNEAGKIDYEILKTKDFFKEGIKRLKAAFEKDVKAALMCSETKPEECHRSKLIGVALSVENIAFSHIDETGDLKDQVMVMGKSGKGFSEADLFRDS